MRPVGVGFERFTVRPMAGGLTRAAGVVPTRGGAINVSWRKEGAGYMMEVVHPRGLTYVPADDLDEGVWRVKVSAV